MPTYLAVGLGGGIILAAAYGLEAGRRKISPSLDDAVRIVVSAVGLAIGGRVVYICFSHSDLGPFHGEDPVYICIGGFALMWISVDQLRNGIFGPKRELDARKLDAQASTPAQETKTKR